MRKADIETRDGMPAVNVKIYTTRDEILAMAHGIEESNADVQASPGFVGLVENMSDETFQAWWDAAAEYELEYLTDWVRGEADDSMFAHPDRLKIYTAGRSGGWVTVDGLSDVDSWAAIDVGRWARFAKLARQIADGVPYQALMLIHLNVWEPMAEAELELSEARY